MPEILKNSIPSLFKTKFGFSLIEIMVTIAIIGILSVTSYGVYNSIQANARDGKRKEDINAIAKAMELNYGKYNTNQYSALCQKDNASPTPSTDCALWFGGDNLLPIDPKSNATFYYYWCNDSACSSAAALGSGVPGPNNSYWKICATLESDQTTPYCQKNQQ